MNAQNKKLGVEIYQSTDGNYSLEVRLDGDTIWLS